MQTALTIAQRRLPIEMTIPPSFRKVNPSDFAVLFISLSSETLPLSAVNEYGDITIGQALSQIQGVAQVVIFGSQKFAIRVQADPEAAAARGISLEDIRAAVSRANSSTPVGTLNGPKQDVALAGLRPDGQGGRLPPRDRRLAQRFAGAARRDRARL